MRKEAISFTKAVVEIVAEGVSGNASTLRSCEAA